MTTNTQKPQSAVYAGSFDPPTLGHLDIIERASNLFSLTILIASNPAKNCLFSLATRQEMLQESISQIKNVKVEVWDGLTVDYCKKEEVTVLIRGIRNGSEADAEIALAQINKSIYPEIETYLIPTQPQFSFVSSSYVRELLRYHKEIQAYVPKAVSKIISRQT
jgi:pantetheine-phosphate adenylyltransferase